MNSGAIWPAGVESITTLSDEEILASGVPRAQLASPNYVRAGGDARGTGRVRCGIFRICPERSADHRSAATPPARTGLLRARRRGMRSRASPRPRRRLRRLGDEDLLHARRSRPGICRGLHPDPDRQRQGFPQHAPFLQAEPEGPEHHRADRLLHVAGRRASRPAKPALRRDRSRPGGRHLRPRAAPRRVSGRQRAESLRPTAMSAPSTPGRMAPSSAAAVGMVVLKRLRDALADGDTISRDHQRLGGQQRRFRKKPATPPRA